MEEIKITKWTKAEKPDIEKLKEELTKQGLKPYVWSDEPGTYYGNHYHEYDEIRWLVSGRMKYGVGDKVFVLEPGDKLELPAKTTHWAEVIGDEPAVYICASRY